jgi:hypothetical protein
VGWNDHRPEDETAFRGYLADLLRCGRLDAASPAGRLAARVSAGGVETLDAVERIAFERLVLDPFGRRKCARCGLLIPWAEMLDAADRGSRCGYCAHMEERQEAASPAAPASPEA